MVSFYIYTPWAIIAFFKFHVNNSCLVQNNRKYYFETNASGGEYFVVLIKAFLLTIVTIGIAAPIAQLMIHKYLIETISISQGFDFDVIEQTEEAYRDATGDDMGDILDLDF